MNCAGWNPVNLYKYKQYHRLGLFFEHLSLNRGNGYLSDHHVTNPSLVSGLCSVLCLFIYLLVSGLCSVLCLFICLFLVFVQFYACSSVCFQSLFSSMLVHLFVSGHVQYYACSFVGFWSLFSSLLVHLFDCFFCVFFLCLS